MPLKFKYKVQGNFNHHFYHFPCLSRFILLSSHFVLTKKNIFPAKRCDANRWVGGLEMYVFPWGGWDGVVVSHLRVWICATDSSTRLYHIHSVHSLLSSHSSSCRTRMEIIFRIMNRGRKIEKTIFTHEAPRARWMLCRRVVYDCRKEAENSQKIMPIIRVNRLINSEMILSSEETRNFSLRKKLHFYCCKTHFQVFPRSERKMWKRKNRGRVNKYLKKRNINEEILLWKINTHLRIVHSLEEKVDVSPHIYRRN